MKFTVTINPYHGIQRRSHTGESAASPYLALYCRKSRRGQNRLGFTVGKKVGCAVKRNRVRRRLREVYRLHEDELLPGYDIVVVARVKSVYARYAQLEKSFLSLADKLGLRKKAEG